MNALVRFMDKVAILDNGCWEWTAGRFQNGYGKFRFEGQSVGAHRVGYELMRGVIPNGLHLDHLCRRRSCVNPWHLEAVTCGENLRRGPSTLNATNLRKTHCPKGHPYDERNTYIVKGNRRICLTCKRTTDAAAQRRRKAAA